MPKIPSFTINHLALQKGVYVSKIDGDIVTIDFRLRKPYVDTVLTNVEMHSLEHLLATALRGGNFSGNVIYVGPMGCATGFYCLFKGLDNDDMLEALFNACRDITLFKTMPGNSKIECGNNSTLDLKTGQNVAKECVTLLWSKKEFDKYPPAAGTDDAKKSTSHTNHTSRNSTFLRVCPPKRRHTITLSPNRKTATHSQPPPHQKASHNQQKQNVNNSCIIANNC